MSKHPQAVIKLSDENGSPPSVFVNASHEAKPEVDLFRTIIFRNCKHAQYAPVLSKKVAVYLLYFHVTLVCI